MFGDDRRRGPGLGVTLGVLLISGVLGTGLGQGIGSLLPGQGLLHDIIAGRQPFGMAPTRFDFWVIDLTLGFHVHFNGTGLLLMVLALIVLRRA
ncbi:MAG: DUF4321 domain-containing protein [bacterium]